LGSRDLTTALKKLFEKGGGAGEGTRTLDINLGKVAEYTLRVADMGWHFIVYRIN